MMQTPGIHVQAQPMPIAPPVAPVTPAGQEGGKLQKYVPLMLVLIIFLLVALLVTVIFLMKH
jgi:hypothetical protein